ncbi:MAG: XRE family transcriptional regulator, partial [Coleofasciculaceae cyanobacterium]
VELPSPETSPFLFELILQIDFKEQSRRFKEVIDLHSTAGFLVHGESCCGQQFLVNRLLRLKRGWKNQSPIKIDLSYSGVGRSIPNLWRELTSWLGLSRDAQPSEIMDRVCDRWQTQDVIFIFYTVDYMLPGMLAAWLQEFWEPLVARATENMPKRNTHLLMFLVDNCGSIAKSDLRLADKFEQPRYPLRLPAASLFPVNALEEWMDMAIAFTEVQFPAELTAQILLERSSNGVPQYVYEEICKHCNLSWD